MDKEEQDKIVEKIENEEAKDFNQAQKLVNRETKIETIKDNPLPDNKYQLIYADPPWKYEHSVSTSREIENKYPTMELKDICDLNVKPILADDCILFLWATSPKLEEAMQVVKAWGFIYKTCMVWVKNKIGMGYYARQQHELLLISTKGSPITPDAKDRVSSVINAERKEHSQKPEIFYEIIEKMYPFYSKIELFARNQRKGWNVWGNQSNKNQ